MLFTCDSFGSHYSDERIFDDLVGDFQDAFRYYFDVILKPFSKFMLRAIDKINALEISVICPGHGPILRSSWQEKVKLSAVYAGEYLDSTQFENNVTTISVTARDGGGKLGYAPEFDGQGVPTKLSKASKASRRPMIQDMTVNYPSGGSGFHMNHTRSRNKSFHWDGYGRDMPC